MSFDITVPHTEADHELATREQMWSELLANGGPTGVPPTVLRALGIYGGAQGIWVNQVRTRQQHHPGGVTVSVLHTGRSYADDFSTDGVLYHYPSTRRPASRDASEVAATKAAAILKLPIFVITHSSDRRLRDVFRGYVEGFEDAARLFLITFAPAPPHELLAPPAANEPLELFDATPPKTATVTVSPRDPRFKFETLQYYGPTCAMCPLAVTALLEAAHIVPKKHRGADDPRNGLILCPLHHAAFDRGYVRIRPTDLELIPGSNATTLADIRIERSSISHLKALPAAAALEWRWARPVATDEVGGP
jgi:hypothetical protein